MRQWKVKDVMTREVVTVGPEAPYADVVSTLAQRGVSAVPVVDDFNRVLGVVSEADLLHKIEFAADDIQPKFFEWGTRRKDRAKAHAGTAAQLMTAPAVTIQPKATLTAAAKLLEGEHIKRLPVVDDLGHLVGIVSRSDLLTVYLRPYDAIRQDIVDQVLRHMLQLDPTEIQVRVVEGIATLTGDVDRKSTAQIAVHVSKAVPGVIDVEDQLTFRYDDSVVHAVTGL